MILVAILILLGINITSGLFDKAFAEESVYKCPSAKQFDIEAQLTCPENNDHFHCVPVLPDFNAVIRICKKPKWFVKGTFPVWSPKYKKITSVPCTSRRYQDYSYKSNNISVFKCSKAKRFCTEKGQTTLFRDHPTENNFCLCMDGYTFLKEPKNGTYCNEDVENCSCIWMRTDQKSETTTKSHFPKKETESASIIRNDEVESTENLEYTLHSTYIILIAVLLCITIVHLYGLATAIDEENAELDFLCQKILRLSKKCWKISRNVREDLVSGPTISFKQLKKGETDKEMDSLLQAKYKELTN